MFYLQDQEVFENQFGEW